MIAVSNTDFLHLVFQPTQREGNYWTASFKENPEEADGRHWKGSARRVNTTVIHPPDANNYFSVALVGEYRRRENFIRLGALVLDDAGLDSITLPPTYILETSPRKFHVGYALTAADDTRNEEHCSAVVKGFVNQKLISKDKSGNNTVRYMRLPEGSNTKLRESGIFRHVMHEWHPERRYSLSELVAGYGIKLTGDGEGEVRPKTDRGDSNFASRLDTIMTAGPGLHDALRDTAMQLVGNGMPPYAVEILLERIIGHDGTERGDARRAEIPRLVESAAEKAMQAEWEFAVDPNASPFVDFSILATQPPPPRQFVFDDWLPRRKVTLGSGQGGIGKTYFGQQLGFCCSNGLDFLGLECAQGPVLAIFCEDDTEELLYRGHELIQGLQLDPRRAGEHFHVQSRVGKPNILIKYGPDRMPRRTEFYAELVKMLEEVRPVLLILDNAGQMYAGLEGDRAQVTAFCNVLSGLAKTFDMAVLLFGHPAKAEGSEYSGSTAWDAAVRSRWFFEPLEDGTIRLTRPKANYAKRGASLDLILDGGVIRQRTADDRAEALEAVKPAVLNALERFTSQQRSTSSYVKAQNNLIRLASAEGLLDGISRTTAQRALEALIREGVVATNQELPWRSDRRQKVHGLAMTTQTKH